MNSFDDRASTWDTPERIERAKNVAKAIIKSVSLSSNMNALEYGCGTGLLSFELREYLGQITLADVSIGMLATLSQKIVAAGITNFRTIKLDLTTDPLPEEKYDIIYTMLTLHHIEDIENIFHCFHSMLNENGVICIADLDKEDGTFHDKGFDGHLGFDRVELKRLAEKCDFRNISFQTAYSIPREREGILCQYPMFLMTAYR
ncbi:MAG: class I SAM-dependent methyltransferase [bacterium]